MNTFSYLNACDASIQRDFSLLQRCRLQSQTEIGGQGWVIFSFEVFANDGSALRAVAGDMRPPNRLQIRPPALGHLVPDIRKAHEIAVTWLKNRYPGCTCDIPSRSCQRSFWRNPNWSSCYEGAEDIWRYLENWAVGRELERYVKFEHKVMMVKWNEVHGVWPVAMREPGGEVFVDN
jgi:hypothetical protein